LRQMLSVYAFVLKILLHQAAFNSDTMHSIGLNEQGGDNA